MITPSHDTVLSSAGSSSERPLTNKHVQLPQAQDLPQFEGLLYLPCEVVEFAVHGQQALRERLWEMLPDPRAARGRDLQRVRPARETMEETSRRLQPKLATRKWLFICR